MTNVQFLHGTVSALENVPVTEGNVYFLTDGGGIYLDINGERIIIANHGLTEDDLIDASEVGM